MIVADYSFAKETILARTLITIDREFDLYSRISSALQDSVRKPDIIVMLDADNEVLLDRIRRRGRPYEQGIDQDYLNRIRDAYEVAFANYDASKIIRCSTSELRLDSQSDLTELCKMILGELPQAIPMA
jgi:deoxyadenosine/deoxycytidine kinase